MASFNDRLLLSGSLDFVQQAADNGIWATMGPAWLQNSDYAHTLAVAQGEFELVVLFCCFCCFVIFCFAAVVIGMLRRCFHLCCAELKAQGANVMLLYSHQNAVFQVCLVSAVGLSCSVFYPCWYVVFGVCLCSRIVWTWNCLFEHYRCCRFVHSYTYIHTHINSCAAC